MILRDFMRIRMSHVAHFATLDERPRIRPARIGTAIALALVSVGVSGVSAAPPAIPTGPQPSFADLADLAVGAPLVAHVRVTRAAALEAARAPGVAPGMSRVFVEADTVGVVAGPALGEKVRFLLDVPVDARGHVPKLKGRELVIAAEPAPDRPQDLKLTNPTAAIDWTPAVDASLRAILSEALAPGAPPKITGIREASYVAGNLAGEGETQIFLNTATQEPATLTVLHRPGEPLQWGVAWGEIVDQSAKPPAPATLGWYRLACGLPESLPAEAQLSDDPQSRAIAAADFAAIRKALGPCGRTR